MVCCCNLCVPKYRTVCVCVFTLILVSICFPFQYECKVQNLKKRKVILHVSVDGVKVSLKKKKRKVSSKPDAGECLIEHCILYPFGLCVSFYSTNCQFSKPTPFSRCRCCNAAHAMQCMQMDWHLIETFNAIDPFLFCVLFILSTTVCTVPTLVVHSMI